MSSSTPSQLFHDVERIFCLMDRRRQLPGFPLERRVAPFFELFLSHILGAHTCIPINPVVIPEFPLRVGTLFSQKELQKDNRNFYPNQSLRVDYVALSSDAERVFLIELKTDMNSLDEQQKCDLRKARSKSFHEFVNGIKEICEKTEQKSKYIHLWHRLSELDLVSIRDEDCLYGLACCTPKTGWKSAIGNVELTKRAYGLKYERIVYIQPCRTCDDDHEIKYIDFEDVAETVKDRGELGSVFARYLCRWRDNPGVKRPRNENDCW